MIKTPMNSKAASDISETGRLICEARGVPNVTFTWTRSGGGALLSDFPEAADPQKSLLLDASGFRKYRVNVVAVNPLTFRSELLVHNVTHKDYGSYECVARNSEGMDRTRVVLDVKSRPDPPSRLRVVNVTHNSVRLAWIPGFDGGMDQYFRIKFAPTEDDSLKDFEDVYPANTDETVLPGLKPGTRYAISIMAFNNIGESNYTNDPPVIVQTSRELALFTLIPVFYA